LKYSKNHIIFVFIFLSLFVFSKLGFIFYESFLDPHFKFLSEGYFLNGQPDAMVNTFGCYIYLSDFFKFAFMKWDLHLFDIFVIFSISLLLYNAYLLINESKNKLPLYFKIGLYTLILAIVLQVESTRISILLSGISTLLLFYKSESNISKKLYLVACIILGLCIRIEGGALSIIFVALVYFVLSNKTKVLFVKLAIVILPVILLYSRVNTPFSTQESDYIKLRPYQYSLWDFNKNQNIDFKSIEDSTIFHTSIQFFLSDKNKMSPQYFEQIGVLKNDKSPTDFLKTISQKKLDTSYLHINGYKKLLYSIFALSFLFIFVYSRQKKQALFVWIAGLITLLVIWILMKMELRALEPFLLIILLYSIYIGQLQIEKRDRNISIIFSLMLSITSVVNLVQYYLYQRNMANSMEKTIVYLNDLPENSKIIINLHPLVSWNNTIFNKNPLLKNKHLLTIDNGLFFLQENYDKYLIGLYGSNDYDVVFKKIADDHSTYFVSDSNRMNLLSSYSLNVYNIKWNYTPIKKLNIADKDIYVYQFNKE
jgi:hypothetical protein